MDFKDSINIDKFDTKSPDQEELASYPFKWVHGDESLLLWENFSDKIRARDILEEQNACY